MLIEGGKEIPIDDRVQKEIENANVTFGKMGERVLAFARLKLDPAIYKETYPFDVKKWKFWTSKSAPGWFPMTGLQLVGLVSLNDPPRPSVDINCRSHRSQSQHYHETRDGI